MTTPTFSNVERVTRITISVLGADGKYIEVGMIQDLTPSERRGVTEIFTLNGDNSEVPSVLIPELVKGKSLKCSSIALWQGNILTRLAIGNATTAPSTPTSAYASLVLQKDPFTIKETRKQASGDATTTTTYIDCFITDYTSSRDITKGDVTIVENVTIAYRKSETTYA